MTKSVWPVSSASICTALEAHLAIEDAQEAFAEVFEVLEVDEI